MGDLRIGLSRGGTATQVEGLVVERQLATTVIVIWSAIFNLTWATFTRLHLRVRWVVASNRSSLCTVGAAGAGDLPVLRSRRNSGDEGSDDDAEAHYVQNISKRIICKGTRPVEANVELRKKREKLKRKIWELEVDAEETLLGLGCKSSFI